MNKKIDVNTTKRFFENTVNIWSVVLLILVFFLINNAFLNSFNIKNLLSNVAPLLVMACGATFVWLVGSIDLSMGAVCSVANVILVQFMPDMGVGAYILAAGFGVVSGALLGVIQVKLKIPSFIASLGFMSIWGSVALLITPSPMQIPSDYKFLIEWSKTSFGVMSLATIIALVITVLFYLFHQYTQAGRSINVIGGNERAARLSGIKVDRYKILAFIICGFTAALCGIMLAAKLKSSAPTVGDSYTLLAVSAVLLGGTVGGRGNIFKTLGGVLIIVIIQNGMTIIGVDAFWNQIVFGALLIVAMILTQRGKRNAVVK